MNKYLEGQTWLVTNASKAIASGVGRILACGHVALDRRAERVPGTGWSGAAGCAQGLLTGTLSPRGGQQDSRAPRRPAAAAAAAAAAGAACDRLQLAAHASSGQ